MVKKTSQLWGKLDAISRWTSPIRVFFYRWLVLPLGRIFVKAGLRRTLVEALTFYTFSLALFNLLDQLDPYIFTNVMLFPIVGGTTLWVCLRLHLTLDDWKKSLQTDTTCMLLLVPAISGILLLFRTLGNENSVIHYLTSFALIGIAVVVLLIFALARMWVCVWAALRELRHKHLRWAFTYAHVLAAILISLPFLVPDDSFGRLLNEALPQSGWVAPLVILLIPLIIFTQMAINLPIFLPLVLPPLVLFSYFVTRRITRRLESLTEATNALGTGHYATRLAVEGEDEIAQLQLNFNTMASKLETTMQALQNEQQRVEGLLQSNRELVASVSHELRTPVATLRGHLESALARWQEAPPLGLQHDLEVMEREVQRLQALIEDLFTLSRAEVGRLTFQCQPVDGGKVVQHLVESATPLAWQLSRVQVVAEVEPDLPPVLADEGRLAQILSNLLQNAIRHTPPGGIVILSAAAEPGAIRFQVCDTGEGIDPEILPHIWERFYQAETSHNHDVQGAGLGLALVKELTEAMHGSAHAESSPGQGSRFTICLPQG